MTVLLALMSFVFKEASEYLKGLVPRIDAHLLRCPDITFFHQLLFDSVHKTCRVRARRPLQCRERMCSGEDMEAEGKEVDETYNAGSMYISSYNNIRS
jgi:hypothetical protein